MIPLLNSPMDMKIPLPVQGEANPGIALPEQTMKGIALVDKANAANSSEASDSVEESFDDQLTRARKNLKTMADQFVANSLVMPLLKELRSDPFKSDMFHGGFGEDVFASQLDMQMAERISGSSSFSIANNIAQQFEKWMTDRPADMQRLADMKVDTVG